MFGTELAGILKCILSALFLLQILILASEFSLAKYIESIFSFLFQRREIGILCFFIYILLKKINTE